MTDRRLVLEYERGQMAFRHIAPAAGYADLFRLAKTINGLQEDAARRVLLVTVTDVLGG